jgi:two-component system chemotaxis response regulator CheY
MPHTVLIVDDSDVTRSMIIKTLDLAQVAVSECLEAGNGKEALELLESNWVDVVFADLNMPVMGGREMLRIMRMTPEFADIPVIVISSERCDPSSLPLSWASGYIRKPFTPEELRGAIEGLTAKGDAAWDADWLRERFDYVLQSVTFMAADKMASDEVPAPESAICAKMQFTAGSSGSLWMAVPSALADGMARNALGEDDIEPAGRRSFDIVGEILNMTAGLVADALSRGAPIRLQPPELTMIDAAGWQALLQQPIAAASLVEDQPLLVALSTTTGE